MKAYAVKHPHPDGGMYFRHIFTHPKGTACCFGKVKEQIYEVNVREVKEGEQVRYWGWCDARDNSYHFIYPKRFLVDMCFTYGAKVEEECGKGKIVELAVDEVGLYSA